MSQVTFHEIHGSDVMVYRDGVTARRIEDHNTATLFTSKPIKLHQAIKIKFIELSEKCSTILSIGFTSIDPRDLEYDIPLSQELKKRTDFWMCSLSKYICQESQTLFFYIDKYGSIHYGVDDIEKGVLEKKANTRKPLWAVFDMWNAPTTIKLANADYASVVKPNKYIFTSRPIETEKRTIIKLKHPGNLIMGVTSCLPLIFHQCTLPDQAEQLLDRTEYWVVIDDKTWRFEENDEISYIISKKGEMKMWKNSTLLLKVIHVDATQELWGFFIVDRSMQVDLIEGIASDQVSFNQETNETETPSRKTDTMKDASQCMACCDKTMEAVFYPCGHLCMCFECAKAQWRSHVGGNCPMCREKIRDVLKVYKA